MVELLRLCARGFRALDRCVDFKGNSVLFGPPNSGKTSLLEALSMLMQSRGEQWILFEGPLLIIHEAEDVHRGGDTAAPFTIEAHWDLGGRALGYSYTFATKGSYVEQAVYEDFKPLARLIKRGDRGIAELAGGRTAELCTAPYAVLSEDALIPCSPVEDEGFRRAERALMELRIGLKDVYYFVSGRRLAAWKYTYETHVDLLPATSVGSEGQYTAHQISRILAQPQFEPLRDPLYQVLRIAGVDDVRVGLVSTGRIAMYIKSGGAWTNAYNAGNFTKSVLPVLVQLILANEGSVVAVDDADLAVPEDSAEQVLSAYAELARRKGLQLVLSAKSPGFAKAAERLGLGVVRL
ncbi:MAG: ATP-binding protein [Thermoproteus sp. AZ2]|uniref:ATP-binding protein n=1 Tax=Thermoproteus sp. AZ2 TaxID=1609232 RepID=A0ACC6V0W0_9CREN